MVMVKWSLYLTVIALVNQQMPRALRLQGRADFGDTRVEACTHRALGLRSEGLPSGGAVVGPESAPAARHEQPKGDDDELHDRA